MTATGEIRRQVIDDMIFTDYLDLRAYWSKFPPIHVLVKHLFTKK